MLSSHTFPMDCLICFKHHALSSCPIFRTYNVKQRSYTVRVHRYCSNCFSRTHTVMGCTSIGRCLKCGELHHTMLHADNDPLTIPQQTQMALNGNSKSPSETPKNKIQKQQLQHSILDYNDEDDDDDDSDYKASLVVKVEPQQHESNDDSEQSDSGCNKTEDDDFENDNLLRDKGGRFKHKGNCFLCRRESKFKRITRQACGTCTKPICFQHSFHQTKCKECHTSASNSEDLPFKADDAGDRDASGRLLHKGRCLMCHQKMKRRRLSRRACSICNKPVCAEHYHIQIKCADCYEGQSKTSNTL